MLTVDSKIGWGITVVVACAALLITSASASGQQNTGSEFNKDNLKSFQLFIK